MFYLLPTFKNIIHNYRNTGKFRIHEELILEEEGITNICGEDPIYRIVRDGALSVHSPLLTPKTSNDSMPPNHLDNPTIDTENHNPALNKMNTGSVIFHDENRLSLPETIKLSAQFCILWFLANFATNASLAYTSVASQTILSSTSSFFTLFVGALFNVESINRLKLLGAFVSFFGIMLVTKSDSNPKKCRNFQTGMICPENELNSSSTDTFYILIGNMLALAGAFFYGVYSTLLKRKVKDENRINMKIFFGFVGLFTLLLLWPSLLLLHHFGWERFEIPTDPRIILIILSNCFITFISDFCWAKAMLLTSPLTVTVGLSITIPVAMLGDFLFRHKTMSEVYLVGASLILGSFFIISRSSEEEHLNKIIEQGITNQETEA
ncbi:hypothetical protein RI543_003063 [Arxiozyma heterogenica]|uniref:EamA domain-containing protein n=2 Tax=Arxiozyma heterogenica TaxID=278026 RepID=A0AAN8A6R0_9SACH|nr:hypothetical protein RI543_003063 [Kazachstania heterogenica]